MKNQYELIFVERLSNMVTLPFLALIFLLFVAFLIGAALVAILKGSGGDSEKKETLLNASKQLDENRVRLDISDLKPSLGKDIKLVKPNELLIKKLEDKKPIDRVTLKPSIDIENDLIDLREWRKKKPGDKQE